MSHHHFAMELSEFSFENKSHHGIKIRSEERRVGKECLE